MSVFSVARFLIGLLLCCLTNAALTGAALAADLSSQRGAAAGRTISASVEIMAGQMILCGFRGTGEPSGGEDLDNLLEDIRRGHIGGVILFDRDVLTGRTGRNIVSLEQVGRLSALLQRAAPIPLFIAVDQEGGRVRRFREEHGVPATPSPEEMGKNSPKNTRKEAARLGALLRKAGVNVDFAPSLDVNVNPQSPAIGALGRSFSDSARVVTEHGRAFAKGLADAGIIAAYKHFPGHGSATEDTHLGVADISASWRKEELSPYRTLLSSGPPAMVMVGHLAHGKLDPVLPASLSPAVIGGLLRGRLGWRGVVITDDLQMKAIGARYTRKEAIRLAVLAGVDILLFGNNLEHSPTDGREAYGLLMELVREGVISEGRIKESYTRIMTLKRNLKNRR